MLRTKLLLGAISLLAIGNSLAAEPLVRTRVTVQHLAKVHQFAIGGVGFAGQTSPGEKDFRVILQDAEAAAAFDDLFAHGNNEAKAYALLGLHQLNPSRFQELYASLSNSGEELETMQGCIISKAKLKEVARQISEGGFSKPRFNK
ncbi:MAG TPA: hypothetical protein VIM60_00115 [Edaphobacter sp.]